MVKRINGYSIITTVIKATRRDKNVGINFTDIYKTDKLIIAVKPKVLNEVVTHYESFGWKRIETKSGKYATLERSHDVKNKDRLQYLQACYEATVSKMARAEKYKWLRLFLLTFFFSVITTLCAVLSVVSVVVLSGIYKYALSSVFGATCVALIVVTVILSIKIRNREIARYNAKIESWGAEIVSIFEKAKELTKYE